MSCPICRVPWFCEEHSPRRREVCFILWYWTNGWRPKSGYGADKVNAVARMIKANFDMPHRVVCVTDSPKGITEAQPIEMWPRPVINGEHWVNRPNCFHRLRVFDTDFMVDQVGPASYYWSMDLDMVIRRNFTSLHPEPDDFVAVEGRHANYNGSMWAVKPYTNQHVWADFHPIDSPAAIVAARHKGRSLVGSDQAWMSLQIPNGSKWPVGEDAAVLQYMNHVHGPELAETAKVICFAGSAKPWHQTVRFKCPQLFNEFQKYL